MGSDSSNSFTSTLTDLYIDIGAKSKDEAQELVELGDVCTFVSDTVAGGYNPAPDPLGRIRRTGCIGFSMSQS